MTKLLITRLQSNTQPNSTQPKKKHYINIKNFYYLSTEKTNFTNHHTSLHKNFTEKPSEPIEAPQTITSPRISHDSQISPHTFPYGIERAVNLCDFGSRPRKADAPVIGRRHATG